MVADRAMRAKRRARFLFPGWLRLRRGCSAVRVEREIATTFRDVGGVQRVVEQLRDLVGCLKQADESTARTGTPRSAVLLVGMRGTGKKLLARAVAGEASVPLLAADAVCLAGRDAPAAEAGVRKVFRRARELAPCLVFIDRLDGKGSVLSGQADRASGSRESVIRRLVREIDALATGTRVFLLAATSRPDDLDAALLEAGRFDRRILVDRPDARSRLKILRIHAKRFELSTAVDLATLAVRTAGFTGGDLAELLDRAARLATHAQSEDVGIQHVEEALDGLMTELEPCGRFLSPREKMVLAVHETGHALAACLLPRAGPLDRVSIIPPGVSAHGIPPPPGNDHSLLTRAELRDRIGVLLGGRVAEELIFGDLSTRSSDDLSRVADLAFRMVVDYGMGSDVGMIAPASTWTPAEETTREIDLEVRRLLIEQEERVRKLLAGRKRHLAAIARVLRDRETLHARAFRKLLDTPIGQRRRVDRKR